MVTTRTPEHHLSRYIVCGTHFKDRSGLYFVAETRKQVAKYYLPPVVHSTRLIRVCVYVCGKTDCTRLNGGWLSCYFFFSPHNLHIIVATFICSGPVAEAQCGVTRRDLTLIAGCGALVIQRNISFSCVCFPHRTAKFVTLYPPPLSPCF